jgi:microcystin-dependent protein
MPTQLPAPGGDWQVWGGELVAFLQVALNNPGGTLKAPVLLQAASTTAPSGRVLAGGGGIAIADAGPGSTVSLSALVDNATLQIGAGAIRISDGGVVSVKLADGSVIAAKLAAGAVTDAKITGPISMAKIGWPGDTTKFIRADGQAMPIVVQIPTGMCLPYAANAAPPGPDFLPCDGASISRTTYAALFTVIGTTYGSLDGNSFNVPDMRGRVPVGKGVHTDVDTVGKGDGTAAANRRVKHQHTVYDPTHRHGFTTMEHNVADGGTQRDANLAVADFTGFAATGVKVNPEGASVSVSPVDAPSYLTLLWCIKT